MPKKKTQTTKLVSTPGTPASQQLIGNYVRQLRCQRKWTQWQLAQISRLSERTIQRIENGHRMGITAELALAGAFEIDIPALYPRAPLGESDKRTSDPPQDFRILPRLTTGAALLDVIEVESLSYAAHFKAEPRQRQKVDEFLQHVQAWGTLGRGIESIDRAKVIQIFQTMLAELDAGGLYVFGARSSEPSPDKTIRQKSLLVFREVGDPQISQPKLLRQFGKEICFITVPNRITSPVDIHGDKHPAPSPSIF
jgi:transcriptional regulator with XRE-family HTH domain